MSRSLGLGVNVFGYFTAQLGIGEATRLNCRAMEAAGIPVNRFNFKTVEHNIIRDPEASVFATAPTHPVNLVQISPAEIAHFFRVMPVDYFLKRYNILYTAWESENMPEEYIEGINFFDEIWTPSHYCKNILANFVHLPITVIPHPIQMEEADDTVENQSFYDKNFFNFLFIFDYKSSIDRKNVVNLIKVFKSAFSGWENRAFLTIKTSASKNFKKEKETLEHTIDGFAQIKIVEENYTRAELHTIISHCDSYISLHRSEGFGLTMAEAMYYGKPVIATRYSGNLEFMNDTNSLLIDAKVVTTESCVINYSTGTIWSEPDLNQAAAALKKVYNESPNIKELARKAQADIKNNLSLLAIGNIIHERLEILSKINLANGKWRMLDMLVKQSLANEELRIYRKSVPISALYAIKMYLRNRKKRRRGL